MRALRVVCAITLVALAGAANGATLLDFGVAEVTQDSARVTWSRTLDWCFTSYDIQFRQTGETNWVTHASISSSQTTEHWITNLQPSTSYEARVVDIDCLGKENSTVQRFSTTPQGPFGLSTTALAGIVLFIGIAASAGGFVMLRRMARARRLRNSAVVIPVDPKDPSLPKCVKCGNAVATEFCGKCGAKQP